MQQKQLERSVSVSEHLSNENLVYFFDRLYPEITLYFQETFDVDNEFWVPENYSILLKDQTLIPKISHNKEFLETNYPQGRAVGVFRRFHFDLKVENRNSVI